MNGVKYLIFALFLLSCPLQAQELRTVTRRNGLFKEVYSVQKKDTSIRHGRYLNYYKGQLIEKGSYKKGTQIGRWRYFNLNNILEYEYDFDKQRIVLISGEDRQNLEDKSPCLFMGSPLIPYLYIVEHLSYPMKARELDVEGKVILALRVDAQGEVYGFYLYERLHPIIDRAVMDVAKDMPLEWQFISATKQGRSIASEYHIAIEFELSY